MAMPGMDQKSQSVLGAGTGDSCVFELQECYNAEVTEPHEHLPPTRTVSLSPCTAII